MTNLKAGIIITTDDKDICFMAIRYAKFILMEQNDTGIYFAGSGTNYQKNDDSKYNLHALVEDFRESGGKVYKSKSLDTLYNRLLKNFCDFVTPRQIDNISHNDKFQSIMTKDVYIRKFIGTQKE